ncbi:MAG: hypothetical protein K0S33_3746 [Bacteroidetes bacterium]|jgi:hypothetical protein|nr:hypothetical protein [Bacteroidota bacterium]
MEITTKNYFKTVEEIGLSKLPGALADAHETISSMTKAGSDWSQYKTDPRFKRIANLAFKKLGEFISTDSDALAGKKKDSPLVEEAKWDIKSYPNYDTPQLKRFYMWEQEAQLRDGDQEYIRIRLRALEKELKKRGESLSGVKPVNDKRYANIQTECMFIDRFLAFHGKVLYKNTFGIFIDDLQKAIDGKKIRKISPVAKEIMEIQGAAVKQFNKMYNADYFVLKPETIKRLNEIVARWENSYDDINEEYAKSKKATVALQGIPDPAAINIMPSTEFASLHFHTIGFKERWLAFIGDPAPGFTAMVFGMPKMGKSYLCMDFAGYLARNHGRVLYVAKEEKLDKTLQDKVIEKEVAHPNLTVADGIPASLADYDFIFLDSVNKLGLTPKDLEKLKADNKGKSFIYVFQATKSGSFKGNNEFQHDVDVVIEVPEKGKAIQYGRFNQGGETDIFPALVSEPAGIGLNGVPKKKKNEEDWTEGKGLTEGDKYFLKKIKECVEQGNMGMAMEWAERGETEVREAIPGEIWLAMGGNLTKTGIEKLKKRGFSSEDISQIKTEAIAPMHETYPNSELTQKGKSSSKQNKKVQPKKIAKIVPVSYEFNQALRITKGELERSNKIEITMKEFYEIFSMAATFDKTIVARAWKITGELSYLFFQLDMTLKQWLRNKAQK